MLDDASRFILNSDWEIKLVNEMSSKGDFMKCTTSQRTSTPLPVTVTLDVAVPSVRYMISVTVVDNALTELETSRSSHHRGIHWVPGISTQHTCKINTCL